MNFEHDEPDCASVSGLLQPYVDGEVSDEERVNVLGHLDGCSSCRTGVQQQQQVRAALRELEQNLAPAALRRSILAELDRMDAEHAGERRGWLAGSFGRLGAFVRGGMLLAPATAAAVGLFFVVRANVDSPRLATQATSLVDREAPAPDGEAAPLAAGPAKPATKLEPLDGAFEMQFATEGALPPGIQLVGAGNATVRFRHEGSAYVDWQRPATSQPRGKEQVFRGHSYYLGHDEQGRPRVQFEVGGVLHELGWDGPTDGDGPVDEQADLNRLVEFADRLQSSATR